jgi:uncharacterized protein
VNRASNGGVLPFFLATFALSWVAWIVAMAIPAPGTADASALSILRAPAFLLGTFAPGIVALFLSMRADPSRGASKLLRGIGRWNVSGRWYLFAAGYLITIKLTVAAIIRLTTRQWPAFGETPIYIMALALLVSTWVQAGEELGWRAYALPRLANRIGLSGASVVLGVIWAVWHLPLFLVPESDTSGQSFPLYVAQVTALSVAMAWLYWRTEGSLLLVMLLHAAVNNTKDIVPSAVAGASNMLTLRGSLVGWLTVALLWIGAGFFMLKMRGVRGDSLAVHE